MDKNHFFMEVIEKNLVDTVYQPIINLKNAEIIGFEALSRGPEGTELFMPMALISQAKSFNKMDELDYLFRKNSIVNAKNRGIDKLLFINIDPAVIYNNCPSGYVIKNSKEYGIPENQIVIEVTERSPLCSFEKFADKLEEYKKQGFYIACDDVGSGYSNLNTLSKINPDFMKIDGFMVKNVDQDDYKKSVLKSTKLLAELTHTTMIAEGVETAEELRTVIELGVPAAQGNFIGKPDRNFQEINKEVIEIIESIKQTASQRVV